MTRRLFAGLVLGFLLVPAGLRAALMALQAASANAKSPARRVNRRKPHPSCALRTGKCTAVSSSCGSSTVVKMNEMNSVDAGPRWWCR